MGLKITVLRHGKASAPVDTSFEADAARRLSDIGIAQAVARRKALGNPTFDIVLASPLSRTQETARYIAGCTPQQVRVLPELGWEKDSLFFKAVDEAFSELGYAPYSKYLEHKHAQVFVDRGKEMWAAVHRLAPHQDAHLLVVGHAVMINAFGKVAALWEDEARALDETAFGECEGFTLVFVHPDHVPLVMHR